MTDLGPILDDLDPLIRMLASDKEFEALSALRMIQRKLAAHGADMHDLADRMQNPVKPHKVEDAEPIPPWAQMTEAEKRKWLDVALKCYGILTESQIRLAADVSRMLRDGTRISARKVEVLDHLFQRLWLQRHIR